MVNAYLQRFGAAVGVELDPLDEDGYTDVRRGSATVGINVLEDHGILLFLSRIMEVPREGREAFYRKLLELNFLVTSDGAFAIDKDRDAVYLRALRRLSGLDYEEFEDLLHTSDGLDEDCDDEVDDRAADAPVWYPDADGDGFGDPTRSVHACETLPGTVADGTDCDDGDADVRPDAAEVCDGVDQDCDGAVDEGTCTTPL
jgi:hypothetical protein